ncbi:MAG: Rid family detoxifying hydrolase [Chloroflexi bacterium]|nr:Rid family detoxifying hydrolase [Chloroflexota bacterium]
MDRQPIRPAGAPRPGGSYTPAMRVGSLIYTAGHIGDDPKTGVVVAGGIEAETKQTLTNLSAVLEAASSSLDRVIKTTVFITNWDDFPAMDAVYKNHFPGDPPARSTVQVVRLARGACVEIEAVGLAREDN